NKHAPMMNEPLKKIRDVFQNLVNRRPSFAGITQIDTSECPLIYEVSSNLFLGLKKVETATDKHSQYWFIIDASQSELVFIPAEAQNFTQLLPDRILNGTISSLFRQDSTDFVHCQRHYSTKA
ncbi:MAG: hypothetical protein ACK5W9_11750, partial [Bdellovibrionales bacterium]